MYVRCRIWAFRLNIAIKNLPRHVQFLAQSFPNLVLFFQNSGLLFFIPRSIHGVAVGNALDFAFAEVFIDFFNPFGRNTGINTS